MALYWLQQGEKTGSPWKGEIPQVRERTSNNPYTKSQTKIQLEPKSIRTAGDLMRSPVKYLTPNTSLNEAKDFIRNNRFRHVPIVDPVSEKLVGLISDRDILRESASPGGSFLNWVNEGAQSTKSISEFMTRKLLTATQSDSLEDIAKAMLIERIGCILIVDSDLHLSGIITRSDILRLLITRAPTEFWL